MDCSFPGSSVHGIFQARILEWVAISFSRGSSWPRRQTHASCIGKVASLSLSHLRSPMKRLMLDKKQYWASQVAQWQRICLQVQETWVRTLGQEDTLEKEMATCSGILAWKIPWIEESGRLQSMGSQRYMTEHACIKGKNNRSEKETWQRISIMCSGG